MRNLLLLFSVTLLISCTNNSKVEHTKTFTIDKEKEFDVFTISGKDYTTDGLLKLQPSVSPNINSKFGETSTYISNYSISSEDSISFVYDVILTNSRIRILEGEFTKTILLNNENEGQVFTVLDKELSSYDVNKFQKEISSDEIGKIGKLTSIETSVEVNDSILYIFKYDITLNKILIK
tara:strand:- start:277 stop:813 length:537 start_codon:yes stop_codon:yes gene_type:complete